MSEAANDLRIHTAATASKRTERLQMVLLLPSLLGTATLILLGLAPHSIISSVALLREEDAGLPGGATANLYWIAFMYLPVLVTLMVIVSAVQAAHIAQQRSRDDAANKDEGAGLAPQPTSEGARRLPPQISKHPSDRKLSASSTASEERLSVGEVLSSTSGSARDKMRLTTAEWIHVGALVLYIVAFLCVFALVHPSNPLFAAVDQSRLVIMVVTVALSVYLAAAILRDLRVTILSRERSNAAAHARRLFNRSRQVLCIQIFCLMHVAVLALSSPPLISPIAFPSGASVHRKLPCSLINATYVASHCDKVYSAAAEVLLQPFGRMRRCDDGGWRHYLSAYDACEAAALASMLRARAYSSLMLSLNVLCHLLFTEMTTGVKTLAIDQWVRVSRSGLPLRAFAMAMHMVALASCTLFLALALTTGPGPFALPSVLNNAMIVNVSCWLAGALLLNWDFFCSKVWRRAQFDVFLSYRVATDATTADRLHDKLSAAGVSVWYDRVCLVRGKEWQQGFIEGLTRAAVYAPILSVPALAPMEHLSPETEYVDNVLVEMRLALELAKVLESNGQVFSICPIFVGPPNEHAPSLFIDNFFAEASKLSLCDAPIRSVEQLVASSLEQVKPPEEKQGGAVRPGGSRGPGTAASLLVTPHTQSKEDKRSRSVAGTIEQLKRYQGVKMLGELGPALDHVTREIVACVDATAHANIKSVSEEPSQLRVSALARSSTVGRINVAGSSSAAAHSPAGRTSLFEATV